MPPIKENIKMPLSVSPWVCATFTVFLGLLSGCSEREMDLILFRDITTESGLGNYTGMTHGAAWGDYDGDGRPDLYLTNHLKPALLFHNLGAGRFANVTTEVLNPADLGGDKHGAAWADFNNDGALDLVQLTGAVQGRGKEPKRLFVNEGGKLVERAALLGVDNPPGRTRMPLWLDINLDGKLDLFQGAEARFDALTPPFLFIQEPARFTDATPWLPLASRGAPFCIVTALNDDHFPELVCRLMGKTGAVQIFDTQTLPARTLNLLPQTAFEDVVAGDFDNDGAIDLFLARKNPGGRVALARSGKRTLTAQIELTPQTAGQPTGFKLRTTGALKLILTSQHPGDLLPTDVRLGAESVQPAMLDFELGPEAARGLPKPSGDARPAVLIGSPRAEHWRFEFNFPTEAFGGDSSPRNLALRIHSTAPIEAVEALGDAVRDEAAPARLFMNRGGKLIEEADQRGLNDLPIAAVNAVGGDFDNDMDLDIFVLGSGAAGKTANLLLLNNGQGKFEIVRNAGGASGKLVGVGDSVTTADVDGDGFLDLLTASGGSMGRSLGLPSDNGGYQLFRNVGNGNRWLMIDLVGTHSNRDGIGAHVRVTSGGVTQTRIQDGGIHERGQNHSRLHFGMGNNAIAERISVTWPNGKIQKFNKMPTNQVVRIEEPR